MAKRQRIDLENGWRFAIFVLLVACGVQPANQRITPPIGQISYGGSGITLPPVVELPSSNFNDRPPGMRIEAIVWHHTASLASARETAAYFANPASRVSSHYIVDRSGELVRCVPDSARAWHAGKSSFQGKLDVNNFSLGIEIANLGDNLEPYPEAQVAAIITLTAYLAKAYEIGPEQFTRHRDVALPIGRKSDTSDNFPFSYALEAIKAVLAGQSPPPLPYLSQQATSPVRTLWYQVMTGDTWDTIADQLLDNPLRADELRYLNPAISMLRPGMRIRIPTDYTIFWHLHPAPSSTIDHRSIDLDQRGDPHHARSAGGE